MSEGFTWLAGLTALSAYRHRHGGRLDHAFWQPFAAYMIGTYFPLRSVRDRRAAYWAILFIAKLRRAVLLRDWRDSPWRSALPGLRLNLDSTASDGYGTNDYSSSSTFEQLAQMVWPAAIVAVLPDEFARRVAERQHDRDRLTYGWGDWGDWN